MSVTDTAPFLKTLLEPAARGTDWLDGLRDDARRAFELDGLPGRRTEEWKYTRLTRLLETAFLPADAADWADVLPPFQSLDAFTVVLSNGRLVPGLSGLDGLPEGVVVAGLADALREAPDYLEHWLGTALPFARMPMASLNTIGFADGVVVQVPDDTVLEKPIHIVHWTDGSVHPVLSSPRIVCIVGKGAAVDIVESHAGAGRYLVNAAAEMFVAPRARLGHYKCQDEGGGGFHIAAVAAKVAETGRYNSFVLQTGASLSRNEIRVQLDGEGAACALNGAYAGLGDQHLDNTTFIDHAVAHCSSRELYKGVLADAARGVFQGKILVRRDAQRTDGHQMNRALLLSRKAEIDSKPELEIYADDVKCSHGATAGELDADQLFYLRARGVGEADARQILVEAFLMEVLDEIESPEIRQAFAEVLADKLTAVAAAAIEGGAA